MPRSYRAGTWEDAPHFRWTKMYIGVRYRCSCEQLGLPRDLWTKEGSYQAANAWWEQRKAEIDLANRPPQRQPFSMEDMARLKLAREFHLARERMTRLEAELDHLRERGIYDPELEEGGLPIEAEEDQLAEDDEVRESSEPRFMAAISKQLGPAFFADLLAEKAYAMEALQELDEDRRKQLRAAVTAVKNEPAKESERCVQTRCAEWVENQQRRLKSAKQADNIRGYLNHFRDFVGGTADVQVIDAAKWERFYYDFCRERMEQRRKDPAQKAGWSSDHSKKVFGTARRFVHWLAGLGLIELPRNLSSREFSFDVGQKAVTAWTRDEFQTALTAATGQLRLHLLLMANCSFGQADIAELTNKQVNWKEGRITHKRKKTRGCENVPTVEYKLWPLTFDLLKQHRNTDRSPDALLLLDGNGNPWRTEMRVDGKYKWRDGIHAAYEWLQNRLAKRGWKFERVLKELRKTGSTLLEMNPTHSRFGEYFLGQSGGNIRARHYIDMKKLQPQFDAAVAFISKELLKGFKGWRDGAEQAGPVKGRKNRAK